MKTQITLDKTHSRQIRESAAIRTNICTELSYKTCKRKMLGVKPLNSQLSNPQLTNFFLIFSWQRND